MHLNSESVKTDKPLRGIEESSHKSPTIETRQYCALNHFEGEDCAGSYIVSVHDETLWGLGTTVWVRCSICQYKSQLKLFEETECVTQRDKEAAKFTKSITLYTDMRFLFATIDVALPSLIIHRKITPWTSPVRKVPVLQRNVRHKTWC